MAVRGLGNMSIRRQTMRRSSTKKRGWRPFGAPSGITRISLAGRVEESDLLCSVPLPNLFCGLIRSNSGGRSLDLPPPVFHSTSELNLSTQVSFIFMFIIVVVLGHDVVLELGDRPDVSEFV